MLTMKQAQRIKDRSIHWREVDSKLPTAIACWTALQELEEEGITLSEAERCDWLAFAWRVDRGSSDINQLLPHALVERYLATLSPEDRAFTLAKGADEVTWGACSWWYLQHSREQVERLHLPQTSMIGAHDPYVIVEQAEGFVAGAILAEKYGFPRHLCDDFPATFWHCLDSRLDGDALVAFYGDDRGYSPTYTVIVTWTPQGLMACYERPEVLS